MNNLIKADFNLCTETRLSMQEKSHQILKMRNSQKIEDAINDIQSLNLNTTSYSEKMPTQIV